MLVTRRPHTVPLSELDPDRIDDALLDRVWSLATNLRHAGIAHRAMTADSVLVDEAGEPIVTDLWEARSHATTGALAHDAAMLCASIALAVGPDRSLAAAVRAIGSSSVGEVLPYLQPLQMNVETRRRFRSTPGLLATLRTSVAVHAQAPSGGIEAPVRVAARNLVPIVALAIAVQVLLPQVAKAGQISKVVQGAHWGWLLVVAAASAASYCMAAISLIGAAPIPLPPLRTIAVQLAAAFTNRIAPAGLGGMATNARYLERSGSGRLGAVSTVGLTSFAGFAVHLAAIGLLLPSLPNQGAKAPIIAAPEAPDYWPLLVAAILVLAILGILFGRRRIQMTLLPGVREAASSLAVVARSPGRLTALFAGSVGVTACYALALVGSVNAFGGGIPVTGVIGVYLAASAIASIAPTPGGLGALEAGLVAGLTTIHLAAGQAVAAVLAYRIITFWLPVAPGALAYRTLRARTVI